jgi:hypothetical protein
VPIHQQDANERQSLSIRKRQWHPDSRRLRAFFPTDDGGAEMDKAMKFFPTLSATWRRKAFF